MKKIILAAALALSVAACETTQVVDKIKEVQSYTALTCKFIPTLATVTALFNQAAGASVASIGNAVCQAVTNIPLADGPGDRKPRVGNVVIKGQFVK